MLPVQIVSDLHISVEDNLAEIIIPTCDILIVLGDVCSIDDPLYIAFVNYVSSNWTRTIIVNGNHEYFSKKSIQQLLEYQKSILPENVTLLNNTGIDLGDYRIIGTTLWSHIPLEKQEISIYLSDYYCIHTDKDKVTVEDTNKFHQESIDFISSELRDTKKPLIVLTHYAPLTKKTSNPMYEVPDRALNHAFATDLSHLVRQCKMWCFGHTHWNADFVFEDCRVVSNPRGSCDDACFFKYKPGGQFVLSGR